MSDAPLQVVFACLGNICRSPMAERIAEFHAGDRPVEWSSIGVESDMVGLPMDSRAAARLDKSGYRSVDHVARQAVVDHLDADLIIAMEERHLKVLRRLGARDEQLALFTDFVPGAEPGSPVPDPYYGDDEGFDDTLATIEAGVPAILARVDEMLAERAAG